MDEKGEGWCKKNVNMVIVTLKKVSILDEVTTMAMFSTPKTRDVWTCKRIFSIETSEKITKVQAPLKGTLHTIAN